MRERWRKVRGKQWSGISGQWSVVRDQGSVAGNRRQWTVVVGQELRVEKLENDSCSLSPIPKSLLPCFYILCMWRKPSVEMSVSMKIMKL